MSKDRKQIILQSLAKLLEERDATKVTTAVLALESGVTEAALYRHFPSKRKIYEGLVDFCERNIFALISKINKASMGVLKKCVMTLNSMGVLKLNLILQKKIL